MSSLRHLSSNITELIRHHEKGDFPRIINYINELDFISVSSRMNKVNLFLSIKPGLEKEYVFPKKETRLSVEQFRVNLDRAQFEELVGVFNDELKKLKSHDKKRKKKVVKSKRNLKRK